MLSLVLKQRGFVLIFALWVLGLLTFLAVSVALGVRQKTLMAEKLEDQNRMYYLQEAVLKQIRFYVHKEMEQRQFNYSADLKSLLHNNVGFFGRVPFGGDNATVSFTLYDQGRSLEQFGVVDEERKINLNTTNVIVLQRLIEQVLDIKAEETLQLAHSILDWRQQGQSQADGFFSNDYYGNLKHAYFKKDANYELLEELLLIKWMTRTKYEKLLPYVTVYGEGKININTASGVVLYALGLDRALVDKVLSARRGKDGLEATGDDLFFLKTFDVASDVASVVKLEPQEIRAVDALNLQGALTTNSYYFYFAMLSRLSRSGWTRNAQAIYSVRENKILYWREK